MILMQKMKAQRERHPFRATANALTYRLPLPVTQALLFQSGCSYPLCPRCGSSLDREYMNFCDRCGQRLAWEVFPLAGKRV